MQYQAQPYEKWTDLSKKKKKNNFFQYWLVPFVYNAQTRKAQGYQKEEMYGLMG